jgi:hypothetical protein
MRRILEYGLEQVGVLAMMRAICAGAESPVEQVWTKA